METDIHDLDGEESGTVELPEIFDTPYRPDLIRRAVKVAQANRKQAYGADEYAGLRTPAESFGSGRGMAHVPRENGQGQRVPQTVGGRKAHPRSQEDQGKKVNDKERKLAVRSAIAATADNAVVAERGHEFDTELELPLVVDDSFEDLMKTQEVVAMLESLNVHTDIERSEEGKSIRAGRGTTRGRKYTQPKSLLFVTSEEPSRAARNLAGADVTTAHDLDAEDLAPGTHPGRLTVWTESSLAEVADR